MGASNDNRLYNPTAVIRIEHAANGDQYPRLDWAGMNVLLGRNMSVLWRKHAGGHQFCTLRWEVTCNELSTDIKLCFNEGFPMIRRNAMHAFEQSVNELAQAFVDDRTYWFFAGAAVAIEYKSELTPLHQLTSVY